MKIAPGYASLPACRRGERRIDRNHTSLMPHCLCRAIIACARAHPAPSALRASDGSSAHDCMLEAMRTQGLLGGSMLARMAAIVFIFLCIAAAWATLGNTVMTRTATQDENLKTAVGQLWGTQQRQLAPQIQYQATRQTKVETIKGDKTITEPQVETISHPLLLDGADIKVDLNLDYRQKGLLWYSIYRVRFDGKYRVTNYTDTEGDISFNFSAPAQGGVYD